MSYDSIIIIYSKYISITWKKFRIQKSVIFKEENNEEIKQNLSTHELDIDFPILQPIYTPLVQQREVQLQ